MQSNYFLTMLSILIPALLCLPACAYPTTQPSSLALESEDTKHPLPLPIHIIHEFPLGTWVENLAIRANGQILATLITAPELYQVDPSGSLPPILVHTFPDVSSLLGIVETGPDIFHLIAGNWTPSTVSSTRGSYSIWRVALADHLPATVKKVVSLPAAGFLNGMVNLDSAAGLVLVADSLLGVVWRVDLHTGAAAIVIDDPLTATSGTLVLGVNGLKIRGPYLYFTNSDLEIFARVPIHPDGSPAGPAHVLATGLTGIDDFHFDAAGNAFIAQDLANQLCYLPDGAANASVLVGSPDTYVLGGPTACQFGRGKNDRRSLYVTSNGGATLYATGAFVEGGRVSRVDVGADGY
ncbi:hypothetical protein MMC11_006474 [Xylographa trunciseda]|nr:hypothetical protein [Xylographa trunciseda]